jgi:hypothetical protein
VGEWWDRQLDRLGAAYEWGIGWDLRVWGRGGWWRPVAVLLAPVQLVSFVLTNALALVGFLLWAAGALALASLPLVALAFVLAALVVAFESGGEDTAPASSSSAAECEPSYPDDCLDPNAIDYDCEGGGGNGPRYVAGPVAVEGNDPFDLDRDGDGVGCDY